MIEGQILIQFITLKNRKKIRLNFNNNFHILLIYIFDNNMKIKAISILLFIKSYISKNNND